MSLHLRSRSRSAILVLLVLWTFGRFDVFTWAQAPPVNGMRPADVRAHAITNATVIPAPGEKIENATIVIRNGVIEAVGPADAIIVPPDARVWKAEGLTVYPGLIEPALLIKPGEAPLSAGNYWNAKVRPEIQMRLQPPPERALRKDLSAMGFTVAAVYPASGALRGSGTVIALADEDDHVLPYRETAAMLAGFDFGGGFGGGPPGPPGGQPGGGASGYPGSLMGAIALLRQAFIDAQWHAAALQVWTEHPSGNEPPAQADSLDALQDILNRRQQLLFDATDEHNALRAMRLAQEFNLDLALLASGFEFRRLHEIINAEVPLIVPLEFPKRPEVSTIAQADAVSLRDLMSWEQAPTNARRLLAGGATIALTTHRLKARNDFHANLRNALKHGLSEDDALAALTTTPAKLLGIDHVVGTIAPGKAANLVVVKGNLFEKDAKIHDVWVNGRRSEIFKEPEIALKGEGTLTIEGRQAGLSPPEGPFKVDLDTTKSKFTLHTADDKKVAAKKVSVTRDQVAITIDGQPFAVEGYVRLAGVIEGQTVTGAGVLPDGTTFTFTMEITPKAEGDEEKDAEGGETASDDDDAPREAAPPRQDAPQDPVSGTWTMRMAEIPGDMVITLTLTLDPADNTVTGSTSIMGQEIPITGGKFEPSAGKLTYSLTGPGGQPAEVEATITGDTMTGTVTSTDFNGEFTGTREGATDTSRDREGAGKDKKDEEAPFVMPPESLNVPFGEYGLSAAPTPENVLLTNAMIWTCDEKGTIIENGSMLIRDGKIAAFGDAHGLQSVGAENVATIDCSGKHITPGLIDCHSHTGVDGSVNEFAQTNTAECRIADCIDPDDINWYRELAGGLVAANQLHGSANPIGGQNSVVKIKWGGTAEDFKIKDAIAGIKFALGENVKRDAGRYPNTRMGVETFIRDAFTAAKDYQAEWERWRVLDDNTKARTMPPRRDLELEAMGEILAGQRLVHCHSYRQDEILMLIRVADHFGFTIGTFQHVLEGYKVAEAIAKHGAGASSFSDWWAYKIEVIDAIPYNGAIMHDVGAVVSFNSDSDELARRMNTEAAKAVRYGGLKPEEALKFVTINPARQLRIDQRTGSLEPGKDADFVIWSGDPLSTYTRCEQTWIDGACMFSLEQDAALRDEIQRERQRIIQKILVEAHGKIGAKDEGDAARQAAPETKPETQPSTQPGGLLARMLAERQEWIDEQLRAGRDPFEHAPGECGCDDWWKTMVLMQNAGGER